MLADNLALELRIEAVEEYLSQVGIEFSESCSSLCVFSVCTTKVTVCACEINQP